MADTSTRRTQRTTWAALGVVALLAIAVAWQARQPAPAGPANGAGGRPPVVTPVEAPEARPHDLSRDEDLGGHTLSRHVALTDEDLRDRLRREPNIRAASTYPDRETAERIVADVIAAERDRIETWSARRAPRPNLALDYRGRRGQVIGRSMRRGQRTAEPAVDAVVVLRARSSPRTGGADYFVLTSYPEVRR